MRSLRLFLILVLTSDCFADDDPSSPAAPATVQADATSTQPVPSPYEAATSSLKRVKTLADWVTLIKDKDAVVRATAASGLRDMPFHAKSAVPFLIELLKDENEDVRLRALSSLQGLRSDAEAAALP